MDQLPARAAEWGLESDYYDARGTHRTVPDHALRRLLASLDSPYAAAPRTLIWRPGRTQSIDVDDGESAASWRLTQAACELASGTLRNGRFELPDHVPPGIFRLAWSAADGASQGEATLIVAPPTAWQLDEGAPRSWLLAVQLYGVRSRRNWGHGDFTDLLGLVRIAAEIGAAGVGLNPLHALFDDRADDASPYSPNSRLFLNPL